MLMVLVSVLELRPTLALLCEDFLSNSLNGGKTTKCISCLCTNLFIISNIRLSLPSLGGKYSAKTIILIFISTNVLGIVLYGFLVG